MSAILRASGSEFDVDAFVAGSSLEVVTVYRRGEPARTTPTGPKLDRSGFNVEVSDAGFNDFDEQLRDAVEFLTRHEAEVRRLVAFPGVEGVVLDFGIAWRDVAAQFERFPAELVRLAGACGIALELSHYLTRGDAPGT
ncbi:MAG TPA: hypothetical protein VH475_13195 [Tepidisphaeraceae bacterium]|jgi:hypothetical protein